jgi:hypothetical protein
VNIGSTTNNNAALPKMAVTKVISKRLRGGLDVLHRSESGMSNIFALLPIYCYSYADIVLGQAGFGATAAVPFAVNIANLVFFEGR